MSLKKGLKLDLQLRLYKNLDINYSEIDSELINLKPTFINKNNISENIIDFKHNENYYIDFDSERLLPQMFSNEGPSISNFDLNNIIYNRTFSIWPENFK